MINETFPQGDYYVRVVTIGTERHLPGNKNVGDVLIRVYPPLHPFGQTPQPAIVDLGQLSSPIEQTGTLEYINGRNIDFEPAPGGQVCAGGPIDQSDDLAKGMNVLFREFRMQVSGPARIDVGLGKRLIIDWPNEPSDSGLWINRSPTSNIEWQKIVNGIIDHPGGLLRIGVGMLPVTIPINEWYLQYVLKISLVSQPQTPINPSPGNPLVIPLPTPRSNDITIGPIPTPAR